MSSKTKENPYNKNQNFGHISYKNKKEVIDQYFSKLAKLCGIMSMKHKEEVIDRNVSRTETVFCLLSSKTLEKVIAWNQ